MNEKIKNVIFDFGGVILDLSIQATVDAFQRLGANTEGALGKYGQKGLFKELELGLVSPEEFCARLLPHASQEEVMDAWNRMLIGIPLRRLQALETLKERYNISLLSNTNDIHWDYSIKKYFLSQGYDPSILFEHLFLSQRMHMAKPDQRMFSEVLRQSGYKAEETLYVDDSAENCRAFAELGVETLTPTHPDEWLKTLCPTVASIGFFDGVHRGHRYLIAQLQAESKLRNMTPMLLTFGKHPREVLQADYIPQLLTTTQEKVQLLRETGVKHLEILDFTQEMSKLKAKDFMKQVLHDEMGVKVLIMGYDHRFGSDGGTHEDYVRWGAEVGIEICLAKALPEEYVSSSECRRLIQDGDVEKAAKLLGHRYLLTGRVGEGHHVGKQLGFPTANIQPEKGKILPKNGAYAVVVTMEDGSTMNGMLNIGIRPTLANGEETSIEVNIFDFNEDLYQKRIQIEFVKRLRDERKFASTDELQQQLSEDRERTLTILSKNS